MAGGMSRVRVAATAGVVAVLGVVLVVLLQPRELSEAAISEGNATDATAQEGAVSSPVVADAVPEQAAEEQIAGKPPATPTAPEPKLPSAPSLDVVRIDATGSAVVAGNGVGGADVTVRLDGEEIATARTDADGNFVSLFDLGSADVPRVLTVETLDATGTVAQATDSIIVAPTFPSAPTPGAAPGPGAAATAQDPAILEGEGPDDVADVASATPPDDNVVADGLETGPVVREAAPVRVDSEAVPGTNIAIEASPDTAPVPGDAPRLFRAGPGGIAVIAQSSGAPRAVQTLGIDAITYDAAGSVSLAGTGVENTELRIYLDNRPVQLARVGQGGTWSSPLPNVDSGVYTLRIDALDADGEVQSRVETPFQRTAPAVAAASRRDGVTAITVQPGFTLWAISEGYFGDGVQFVQIFETNRDQIRDPDLIFPGQVFNLPPAE